MLPKVLENLLLELDEVHSKIIINKRNILILDFKLK